jgi:hypothetical protein
MPQQATNTITQEPDFIPGDPEFIPGGDSPSPVQKRTTPAAPEPTYTGEALRGVGRAVKGLVSYPFEAMKLRSGEEGGTGITRTNIGPTGRMLLHAGEDIIHSLEASKAAGYKAKASGEGPAGQLLRTMEEFPVLGGIVKKAEEAGPGYAKFKPQTLGAVAEGATLVGAPKAVSEAVKGTYGIKYRGVQLMDRQLGKHTEAPVETGAVDTVMDEALDLAAHMHKIPAIVRGMISEWEDLKSKPQQIPTADGGVIDGPPKGVTFGDLVKFRRALDADLWPKDEKPSSQAKGIVYKLRGVMDKEEYKTINRAGGAADLSEWVKGKNFYRRGSRIESAGRVIGGAAGTAGGVLGGAEAVRSTGLPYGGWMGGAAGGPLGGYLGTKIGGGLAKAYVEAGKPTLESPLKGAMREIREEPAKSVEAAKNFGQESPVEHALRRAGRDPGEAAEIARRVEENVQARKARGAPTKDPNRPASEIMEDAKAEYEKKYGKPRPNRESEMRLRHEEELAREKAKPMGEAHMAQHFEAWQEAQKSGGSLSEQLQKAAKIQKPQTNRVMVNVEGQDRMVTLTDAQMERWKAAEERYKTQREANEIAFKNDPTQRAAKQKALGMQWAAEKRQITGELTAKEQKAITQREATNYVGKSIKYKGQSGKVTGHAFGRVKIQLADGSNVNVKPEDLE